MMELLGQLIPEKFKKKKRGFFLLLFFGTTLAIFLTLCDCFIIRNDDKQVLKN